MSVEISVEWQDFDILVTITEWEDEDLFPLSGAMILDGGKFDSDSLQDMFLKNIAEFVLKHHDKIFDEIFTADININKAYNAINDNLLESRLEEKLDRDIEEWDRRIDR